MAGQKIKDKESKLEEGIRWQVINLHKTVHGVLHTEKDGIRTLYGQFPKRNRRSY